MAVDERWIAWLAGFIEGEGYIEMQMNSRRGYGRAGHGYGVRIGICNSDLHLIEKCREILRSLGIECNPHRVGTGNKLATRECFALRVTNREDVMRLLAALMPYLVRLRLRAEGVARWLAMRAARTGYNPPYSEDEIALAHQIRALSSSGLTIPLEECPDN